MRWQQRFTGSKDTYAADIAQAYSISLYMQCLTIPHYLVTVMTLISEEFWLYRACPYQRTKLQTSIGKASYCFLFHNIMILLQCYQQLHSVAIASHKESWSCDEARR